MSNIQKNTLLILYNPSTKWMHGKISAWKLETIYFFFGKYKENPTFAVRK